MGTEFLSAALVAFKRYTGTVILSNPEDSAGTGGGLSNFRFAIPFDIGARQSLEKKAYDGVQGACVAAHWRRRPTGTEHCLMRSLRELLSLLFHVY